MCESKSGVIEGGEKRIQEEILKLNKKGGKWKAGNRREERPSLS